MGMSPFVFEKHPSASSDNERSPIHPPRNQPTNPTNQNNCTATFTQQAIVHQLQLTDEMAGKANDQVNEAMDIHTIEKDIATHAKMYFDKEYGGTWHCVVGRNFSCSVTHETKYLVFFQVDQLYVLLFCSDDP